MRKLLSSTYFPFGTQYYRAPSPRSGEWDRDLAAIAGLGMNTVKFWVQWRWNNPREGEYMFDDIDRLMELAGQHRLRVMLNTIVDVAPAWIYRKYPDASMLTLDGRRIGPQVQPHRQIGGLGLCFNHRDAQEHLFSFLAETVRRYQGHPALEIWNVASEPELTSSMAEMRLYADHAATMGDMLCFCDWCRAGFVRWLEQKYGTIDALNISWNRNYGAFDEVELPRTRNSFNDIIDWRMFFVDTLGKHVARRFEVARKEDPRHPLMCHHVFIQGFPVTSTANDPWNVGRFGDLHGITQMDDPMMCDVLRSCARGKPVISAEMLMLFGYTLDLSPLPSADDVKRNIFTGIAANLKGFVFWQFRPETLAREAPAWGLTHPDGSMTPWLKAFAACGKVLQQNADFLLDASPRIADVAMLYSPENQVFGWAATGNEKDVTDSLLGMHRALYEHNFVVDLVHPGELEKVLDQYRIMVIPFPYFLRGSTCKALQAWVEAGGVLIGEAYMAGWNPDEGMHNTTVPGFGLEKVFGARQLSATRPDSNGMVELVTVQHLPGCPAGTTVRGTIIREALKPEGAQILAAYANGEAAATVSIFGRGKAILVGSYLALPYHRGLAPENGRFLGGLVEWAASGGPIPGVADGRGFRRKAGQTGTQASDAAAGSSGSARRVPRRPQVDGQALVRLDLLTGPDGAFMLIARNLSKESVRTAIRLPLEGARRCLEQFTGEPLELARDGDGVKGTIGLRGGEVKVYRA